MTQVDQNRLVDNFLQLVKIDSESKQVVIGTKDELAKTSLTADRLNWMVDVPKQFECTAMIRYRHTPVAATVTRSEDVMTVEFVEHVHGVAPGQAVVCYDGNRVIGGGWIQ